MSVERRGGRAAFGFAGFDALRGGAATAAARGFIERTRDVTFFATRETALRARATSDDFAVAGRFFPLRAMSTSRTSECKISAHAST
jgi:hypothetical protein